MAAAAFPEDPYVVLGVSRSASGAELKRAYRDLSLKVHPDKDRVGHPQDANARFQRVKSAYEFLCDPSRRRALDARIVSRPFQRQVIVKPFVPASKAPRRRASRVGEAARHAKRSAEAHGRGDSAKHARPLGDSGGTCDACPALESDDEVKQILGPQYRPEATVVLDSEEETEKHELEEAARQELQREVARVRVLRAEEQARRFTEGERRNTDPLPSGADAAGYVRLVLRGGQAPTAAELERSFDEFGAFVASLDQRAAVLKVSDEAKALACARAFHAWPSKPHCAAVQAVLRRIRVVAAPVAADGRALPGSHPVMAATRGRLTAVGGV